VYNVQSLKIEKLMNTMHHALIVPPPQGHVQKGRSVTKGKVLKEMMENCFGLYDQFLILLNNMHHALVVPPPHGR